MRKGGKPFKGEANSVENWLHLQILKIESQNSLKKLTWRPNSPENEDLIIDSNDPMADPGVVRQLHGKGLGSDFWILIVHSN